jgi:FHS family glucose/mannose:H+ symporter-like MFS transporter
MLGQKEGQGYDLRPISEAVVKPIHRGRLFVAACAGMATFGFSLALLGTLFGFPEMRERLHVDVMKQGEMSSLLIVGIWLSTVVVGPLIDRFGNKLVLAVSSFLVAAAFLSFAAADSFPLAAVAAMLLGFGGGGLNTSTNVAVSELYDDKRGAMLNILGIFFGAGAVVVPLLAARMSPHAAILFAAGFAALMGVIYTGLRFPAAKEAHGFSLSEAIKVVAYPGVLLFSFLLFFESGNEQVMNTFTSTWLGVQGAGATPKIATYVLIGYQMGMAIGRIAAAKLLSHFSKQAIVLGSAVGSVVGTGVLFISHSVAGMATGVVITGLSFAAIYPTILAIAGDRYQRFAGTVFGALFAIALVGGFLAPSAVGLVGSRVSVHAGTAVPLVGTLMVTVLTLAVMRSGHAQTTTAEKCDAVGSERT